MRPSEAIIELLGRALNPTPEQLAEEEGLASRHPLAAAALLALVLTGALPCAVVSLLAGPLP